MALLMSVIRRLTFCPGPATFSLDQGAVAGRQLRLGAAADEIKRAQRMPS